MKINYFLKERNKKMHMEKEVTSSPLLDGMTPNRHYFMIKLEF